MNNICKNKISFILNIMVKTGTLNFYCRYQSIKKPSCKCVRYNKHGITNCTKFEYRSHTRDL